MKTVGSVAALTALLVAGGAHAQTRQVVRSGDDLPRYTYPVPGTVAEMMTASPDRFEAFAKPVVADDDRTFAAYDIQDKSTLRHILRARLGAQIASGNDDAAALETVAALEAAEDKVEAKLTAELVYRAFLEARLQGQDASGVCPARFSAVFARHVEALPWGVVGVRVKMDRGLAQVATPAFITGFASDLQPTLDRSHALSSDGARKLIANRADVETLPPCREAIASVLGAYVKLHDVHKPDIWAARAVVLTDVPKLTPVTVAIWDSGFDRTLFPGQVLLDGAGRPVRGPAFDEVARPVSYDLIPLSPEQTRLYPSMVADEKGISDLQNGIDSPAADAFRKKVATLSPAQAQSFFELSEQIGGYIHGTHVTGIAAAGDPAIRLTSAVMTYDNKPVPTPPDDAIQARLRDSYVTTAAWFRDHGVRVVNMSFGVRPSDYESVLEKNGIAKTAEDRKRLARHYFEYEREGFLAAIKSAPNVLFVAAAMNNDADIGFDGGVPGSLGLPNLLTVGAVDQAGGRTGFTSTGRTVRVYASGYNVDSVAPGGAHVEMSGTSMATPAVTNLAAKLLAIDPKLTPVETIALIEQSCDRGDEPGIRLINPKRAVALLKSQIGAPGSTAAR